MTDWTTPATTHDEATRRKDWETLCKATATTIVSSHSRQGLLLVEHYQPHIWKVESPTGQSIYKNWFDDALRQKALERTQKHYTTIYKSEIRRNLAFFSKAPLPTIYRPLLVKGIVEHLGAKRVLDPSIGWGGRILGTMAIDGTTFTGCEPCSDTFTGLTEMTNFLGFGDRVRLHKDDCLNVLPTLPSASFDLVLTSPPYFDLEVYCHEPTQSVKRFPTWSAWVIGFLEPMIRECLRCLTPTGVSAWSVKNMKKCKLRDEVVRIHTAYGFVLGEVVGMTATPRNTGKSATLTEETLLFRRR